MSDDNYDLVGDEEYFDTQQEAEEFAAELRRSANISDVSVYKVRWERDAETGELMSDWYERVEEA